MDDFKMTDIGLQNLRSAIIEQAAWDWLTSKRKLYLMTHGYEKWSREKEHKYRRRYIEAIDFFNSDWFTQLSNGMDGKTALDGLESYYPIWYREQNQKKYKAKKAGKKNKTAA